MNTERLTVILSPPRIPYETPQDNWQGAERIIGRQLPPDFKMFIEIYGSGRIDKFLTILNPYSSNRELNLINRIRKDAESRTELIKSFDQAPTYPIFPASPCLIPFGSTDNGDTLYWLADGVPESWAIVVGDARSSEYQEFEGNMTSYLVELLSRRKVTRAFPRSFPTNQPRFEPFRPND